MKTTTDGKTKRLAALIARRLFTDGSGDRAQRLVMERNGARGAGWGEAPMADRIAELLHAAQHQAPRFRAAVAHRRPSRRERAHAGSAGARGGGMGDNRRVYAAARAVCEAFADDRLFTWLVMAPNCRARLEELADAVVATEAPNAGV